MTSPSPGPAGPEVALLKSLLAAEHAAVYGYGVLGARLAGDALQRAREADDAHRGSRDALVQALLDRGAARPAALPAYDVAVSGPDPAAALAARLEDGLALRWHDLVAATDSPALRGLAVPALVATAVRAAQWRALTGLGPPTVALPGVG